MTKLDSLSNLLFRLLLDGLRLIRLSLRPHCALAAENLFLRKQLALYLERKVKPGRASDASRLTLVLLSSLFGWRRALTIVQPDTFIRWHRKGFRLFWRWKSKPRGRPRVPAELQKLTSVAEFRWSGYVVTVKSLCPAVPHQNLIRANNSLISLVPLAERTAALFAD